ncbi:MAG TPA: hypothetical protein VIX41_02125 [Acidimicrobiales bacterium]
MNKALVTGKAVRVDPPSGAGEPFLVVRLGIDCDVCGGYEIVLAGHHLRPVVALLQEIIAAEPALTDEGAVLDLGRRQWSSAYPPGTPEHN